MDNTETIIGGKNREFPDTHWSRIINAKGKTDIDKHLGALIDIYWKPVYHYVKIAWNKTNEDAKDLTQEFFTKFLKEKLIRPAAPEKGKFRIYIKTLLKHFLINHKAFVKRLKRGGEANKTSLEQLSSTDKSNRMENPQSAFDQKWFECTLQHAIKRLKKKLYSEDKDNYFKIFEQFYLKGEKPTYTKLAEQEGLKLTDVRNYLTYSRALLKSIIMDELSKCTTNYSDLEEEYRLFKSLAKII